MRRISYLLVFSALFTGIVSSDEFILKGTQESVIQYRLEHRISPFPGLKLLTVSFVEPSDFTSPTFSQKISDLKFDFSLPPAKVENSMDIRGNRLRTYYWNAPAEPITCRVSLKAVNRVQLAPFLSSAGYPRRDFAPEIREYLKSTPMAQSGNPLIKETAAKLTGNAPDYFSAALATLRFVVDHMRYTLTPESYDAVYSLKTGKGNCQNYSHLAAALLRAAGIPTRVVNGITLKKAYNITAGDFEYSFEMAQGRHSWIEVYFPDAGWVPFDPQQTVLFVHNRYLRIETGLDNEETGNDGLVRWSGSQGSAPGSPKVEEAFEAAFTVDKVDFQRLESVSGPRNLLLMPQLVAAKAVKKKELPAKKSTTEEPPAVKKSAPALPQPEKPSAPPVDYSKLTYSVPFTMGNLDFPRNVNFLEARYAGGGDLATKGEIRRSFLVETAEYVTSRREFTQCFVLEEPIVLQKAGLALHNFGGEGEIWLEILEDSEGNPGATAAVSPKSSVRNIVTPRGYDWVEFDFSGMGIGLTPGRYWIVLKYSGSPIVNWFYTYGKPVGPLEGTRSRALGGVKWDRVLTFEFNYRIAGLSAVENQPTGKKN